MKVKVKVKYAPLTQVEEFLNQALAETQDDLAAALAERERLFQKNRDLERDLVCAERDFQDLKHRFSDACAERDNATAAYKQVCASLNEALKRLAAAEKDAAFWQKAAGENAELATDESATVTLREKQIVDMGKKIDELQAYIDTLKDEAVVHREEKDAFDQVVADFDKMRQDYEKEIKRLCDEKQAWINRYEELRKDTEADRVKTGEIYNSCDEIYQKVLKQRNEAWDEIKRLGDVDTECNKYRDINEKRQIRISEMEEELAGARARIDELQKLLVDASDTIVSLRTQIELKPKFTNLWNLLQENGLIADTEGGVHNHGENE